MTSALRPRLPTCDHIANGLRVLVDVELHKPHILKAALHKTQQPMFELRPFYYFARVAEAGSLTKAAIGLDISPSIVSRQIQELERTLGYRVFYRTGRGIRLTELGRQLYPRVKEVLIDATKLSDEAKALGGAPSGTVTVGLPGTVAAILAGPLYRVAQEQYPKVFMRLTEGLSGVIDELLTLGRIDIGLFFTEAPNARKEALPLCAMELVLVAKQGDKLSAHGAVRLKQLDGIPLILPSSPHALRQRIEEVWAEHKLKLMVPFEADALTTRKEVVAAGGGYTLAPFDAIAGDVSADRIQIARIAYPSIKRYLVLASARRGPVTLGARAIASLMPGLISGLVRDGHWKARLP